MPNGSTFPERLAERMEAWGLIPASLAKRLGIGQSTVSRWLDKNNPTRPQPRMALHLADILSVRMSWLLDGQGPMEPTAEEKELKPWRVVAGEKSGTDAQKALAQSQGQRVEEVFSRTREEPSLFISYSAGHPNVLTPEELHSWQEILLLLHDIDRRLVEVVTDKREEASTRLKQRLDEYLAVRADLRPEAAQFMKEELKRDRDRPST
jgi:transcriptional regulator with XRE-family HTH domain